MSVLFTLILATASAQQPTAWPEGETQRVFASTFIRSPYVIPLMAIRNEERLGAGIGVEVVLACAPERLRKKSTDIRCTVEDAGVSAIPIVQDAGRIGTLLGDYEGLIERSTVHFSVKEDGRLQRVRLETAGDVNERERFILMTSEKVMNLALSPMDFPRPEDGRETWTHRSPQLGMPMFNITTSSLSLEHTASDTPGQYTGTGAGAILTSTQAAFELTAESAHTVADGRVVEGQTQLRGESRGSTGSTFYGVDAVARLLGDAAVPPLTSHDLSEVPPPH